MNRYKQLVSNGCSFVYACHENLSVSWPGDTVHFNFTMSLAKKLKCSYKILATSGGSNERAFRTTFEWIQGNKEKVKDTLFIIGLTESARTEVFLFDKWRIIIPVDIERLFINSLSEK